MDIETSCTIRHRENPGQISLPVFLILLTCTTGAVNYPATHKPRTPVFPGRGKVGTAVGQWGQEIEGSRMFFINVHAMQKIERKLVKNYFRDFKQHFKLVRQKTEGSSITKI